MLALSLAALVLTQTASPDSLDAARRAAERGELGLAEALVRAEVEKEPSAPALAFLAQLQVMQDEIPQGAGTLARALAMAPDQFRWRTTLGALYYRLGKLAEARRELERVVREHSPAPVARYYLAAVLKAQGELDAARAQARAAIERMPPPSVGDSFERVDFPLPVSALHLLAEIEIERGGDAEALLREVLRREPTHPGAHYLLGRLLLKRGDTEEGERELAIFDRTLRAHRHLQQAVDFRRAGHRQAAEAELLEALEAYPDHPRALFFLARELRSRGDLARAEELLRRLVRLRPDAESWLRSVWSAPR